MCCDFHQLSFADIKTQWASSQCYAIIIAVKCVSSVNQKQAIKLLKIQKMNECHASVDAEACSNVHIMGHRKRK